MGMVFVLNSPLIAQSKDNKWVAGASVSVAKFESSEAEFIGDQFNFQIPRLHVSRYLASGWTLEVGLSFSTINKLPGIISNGASYFSGDTALTYDFGMSKENIVPYFAFGSSVVKMTRLMTPTFNVGGGGTFWLNPRYGLNMQMIYKYSPESFESMRSHYHFSIGMVYSLKLREMVSRLWQHNH